MEEDVTSPNTKETNEDYTVFHPLVVEVLCVLFLDYARWLGQKNKTNETSTTSG